MPQKHVRMNFRRDGQSLFGPPWRVDFFAPESVLTPDGRRVMWAWLASLGRDDGKMDNRTIESLPRELRLAADGGVRIRPLRELDSLRRDPVTLTDLPGAEVVRELLPNAAPPAKPLATFPADSAEIRVTVAREQAARKLFGFVLFGGRPGGGLPIVFRPEIGTLRVGSAEAPFSVADLPAGEDVELRIFVDKYLVEVFVNDRQSVVASYTGDRSRPELSAFTVAAPTTIKKVETWRLEPTNQGFLEARKTRVWEPAEQ